MTGAPLLSQQSRDALTQPLRQVQDVSAQPAERADFTFWSADWTPWRALPTLAETWSALRFEARPTYGLS